MAMEVFTTPSLISNACIVYILKNVEYQVVLTWQVFILARKYFEEINKMINWWIEESWRHVEATLDSVRGREYEYNDLLWCSANFKKSVCNKISQMTIIDLYCSINFNHGILV